MKKKLQIFISSTYEDLKEERQAAVQAVLNSGHIPAGMELFTAGDESQKETIKRWIDESDVYFLILGGRYGSLDESTGKSYTHWEYEYAGEIGKPRFAVVIKDDALEEKVRSLGTQMMEKNYPEKYKEFREDVLTKVCKFYKDLRDIQIAIYQKLAELKGNVDLVGWVYGGDVPNVSALYEENAKLRIQNEKLTSELDKLKIKNKKSHLIGDIEYKEMKEILSSIIITVPPHVSKVEKEVEWDVLNLLLIFKDRYATGIKNKSGMDDVDKFGFFRLAPKLMTFDLLEKKKVAGVRYEIIQMSKTGFKFLQLLERDNYIEGKNQIKIS